MRCIEAPAEFDRPEETSLFLAGGITRPVDWRRTLAELLADTAVTLLNPWRTDYPHHDLAAEEEQIAWEHRHLRRASGAVFWFPAETLCPIALYELGAVSTTGKPLFVGMAPGYAKRGNVVVQLKLARPDVTVCAALEALAAQVRSWLAGGPQSRD
jgi:hypothetical protein